MDSYAKLITLGAVLYWLFGTGLSLYSFRRAARTDPGIAADLSKSLWSGELLLLMAMAMGLIWPFCLAGDLVKRFVFAEKTP